MLSQILEKEWKIVIYGRYHSHISIEVTLEEGYDLRNQVVAKFDDSELNRGIAEYIVESHNENISDND